MNHPEKRRGGGSSSGHTVRTGSRRHSNAAAAGSSSIKDKEKDRESAGTTTGSMPTLPPRAAVINAGTSTPEEPHDGGVSLKEKEKDAHDKVRDSQREKDTTGGGTGGSGSSPNRVAAGGGSGGGVAAAAAVAKGSKQRDAQLRERDERIAYLEREMDVMEREFQRELDKLSQNESETATFWQAKHSALNQQFLRTDTELRLLRSEVDVREAEREELRQGWEVLRRELKERDDEIRGLRGQVRGLKEFVSTSTRTGGQTSDEVFGDGMARLGNGLQNWVIVNFRKAKMDLEAADEATLAELSELVPMYEELVDTSKVHLLQSIVSSILVEMVFNAYYVGLSEEQTSQFRKMEDLLLSFTGSDEPVNQWRSSTLALFQREAPQRLSEETAAFTERVMARINRILDAATTASTAGETRDSALRVLVNNSIELARLLAVQKAILRVYMPTILPHQSVPFEPDTMEDIGGEDEDALATREICCVAFPGIIKHGDESGGHLQYRNVITKARVLCSPE